MNIITFFNNKSGVGKTSLVYHLAWMFAEMGKKVIAADFDPQANLTSMFLEEERLEEVWPDGEHPLSILGAIRPILKGTGDIATPHVESITENLGLIIGDLGLSIFEDKLSDAWNKCYARDESSFRIISSFYRLIRKADEDRKIDLALIDVGPNLGAINRAALISARYAVIPLAPDLFSLQGLQNLGPTLGKWRIDWKELIGKNPADDLELPAGEMEPIGYIVMQHAIRSNRPVKAYAKWINRIPDVYRKAVLDESSSKKFSEVTDDHYCLSMLKHFWSLMPMAMESRKPMFFLKPADGAIGSHLASVEDCFQDFRKLASRIENSIKS